MPISRVQLVAFSVANEDCTSTSYHARFTEISLPLIGYSTALQQIGFDWLYVLPLIKALALTLN